MALVAFTTYVPEVAPHVEGAPTPVIARYIRQAVIDLCERAKVWRTDLAALPLVAGTYDYTLASPIAGTEVSSILDAKCVASLNPTVRSRLDIVTQEDVLASVAGWPNVNTSGSPLAVFRDTVSELNVVPVPDAADTYTLYMNAAIRPTLSATTVEDSVMNEWRRVWYHGAIHELLVMPGHSWSNEKLAAYHGRQWEFHLNNAKARANKGFSRTPIFVTQNPWA